jgi:glutamate 5-kinase
MVSRSDLINAKRVVIKAGTSIVCNPDGMPSLVRIAQIVEAAHALLRKLNGGC